MNLDSTCTQEQFGQLVGISQQAVSDLLARTVIKPGDTAGQWLLDYTAHLREQAAGRGADGKLADQRARLAEAQAIRIERLNHIASGEYVAISLIEQVLAAVGRRIASVLEPLPVNLHRLCPELGGAALKLIQVELAKACDLAVSASLEMLTVSDEPLDAEAGNNDDLPFEDGDVRE
jgi:phage terminase Nu1 subunit (DNA packaging protein)